jgi:hypothetical protein
MGEVLVHGSCLCQGSASLEKTNDDDDQGHHQQNVDQSTGRVGGDYPEQPQHQKYECKSPEHDDGPFIIAVTSEKRCAKKKPTQLNTRGVHLGRLTRYQVFRLLAELPFI